MGRRRTACKVCASIKAACNQGRPCARCRRLYLVCEYADSSQRATRRRDRMPSSATVSSRSRAANVETADELQAAVHDGGEAEHGVHQLVEAGVPSAALGCTECHRRRKKCDGGQPDCGDCERLGRQCRPRRSQSPPAAALPHERISEPAIGSEGSGSHGLYPRLGLNTNMTGSHAAPYRSEFAAQQGPSLDDISLLPSLRTDWLVVLEHETIPSPKPSTSAQPSSVALVDLPIPRRDDEIEYATFLPPTALSNLTGVTPEALRTWNIGERYMLNHFLQSVSRSLVMVTDMANPFLLVAVPMALESKVVKHALLTLSTSHLAVVYPVFHNDMVKHRKAFLQEMRESIEQEDYLVSDLMAILLLCLAEICIGTGKKWYVYLEGFNSIWERIHPRAMPDTTRVFLVQLHDYLRAIASATSGHYIRQPAGFQDLVPTTMPAPGALHPLLGFAAPLYQVLPSIARLLAMAEQGVWPLDTQVESPEVIAREAELTIQSWTPSELGIQDRTTAEAEAAAFATQRALLLLLVQATQQSLYSTYDLRSTRAVDNILSALSLIRPGSEIESRLLFPLFMAGVASNTKPNRLTVGYRLGLMETTIGFGHIATARALLEDLWKRRNEGDDVDWRLLMRVNYPGLVLF